MPYGTITAPSGLWLRRSPNANSSKLVHMPFASRVEILRDKFQGRGDAWLHLQYQHQEGYGAAEWVGREPVVVEQPAKRDWMRVAAGVVIVVLALAVIYWIMLS